MEKQICLANLRQILTTYFDEGELRTLCFDLTIDYQSLPGSGKADKARELVAHCERHNCIPELVSTGKRQRPDVSWDGVLKGAKERQPKSPKPGRGLPRTPIPWWRSRKVWVPIIVALIGLAGGIIPIILTRCNGNGDIVYLVRVEDSTTRDCVQGAKVIIEVPKVVPLDETTDINGIAAIEIDSSYAQQRGKLIVEASGYEKYEQHINLVPDALPDVVQLTPRPTATYTPTPTSTPTLTPTYTPTPTSTPTLTPTYTPTPTHTFTLTPTDALVPSTVVSSDCSPGDDLVAPSMCVASVSVQINGTPRPVGWNDQITLTAGSILKPVNLRYCTSGEDLADAVAGEAYLFPSGVETYTYSLFTRRSPRIRAGCGDVGDFEGSWVMEPGQHEVVIALMHYFSSEKYSDTVKLKDCFTGQCKKNGECEVDDRFRFHLHVK